MVETAILACESPENTCKIADLKCQFWLVAFFRRKSSKGVLTGLCQVGC